MIFVIQTCKPRNYRPLWFEVCRQIDETWQKPGLGERPQVIVHEDLEGAGQLVTMLSALERARLCGERWRWPVTLLEDDVEICEGFVAYVASRWRDSLADVVRWYAPGGWVPPAHVTGRWVHEEGAEYGFNQAATFASDFVWRLADSPFVAEFMKRGRHGGDDLIAMVLDAERGDFATHVPGLVQHLGSESLVAVNGNPLRAHRRLEGKGLRSDLYIGRDFDPRKVLK
jgi:hypothetical protein